MARAYERLQRRRGSLERHRGYGPDPRHEVQRGPGERAANQLQGGSHARDHLQRACDGLEDLAEERPNRVTGRVGMLRTILVCYFLPGRPLDHVTDSSETVEMLGVTEAGGLAKADRTVARSRHRLVAHRRPVQRDHGDVRRWPPPLPTP